MTQNHSNRKNKIWSNFLIILSIIGLTVCIAVLFPQVRHLIIRGVEKMIHKEIHLYQMLFDALGSYAMGGICSILFIDWCSFTNSGRRLTQNVKREMKECISQIDFTIFIKPIIIMSGIYLLGILTIMRADFLYMDDLSYAVTGHREWYNWSRYVIVFLSCIVQPEIRLTDISPLPQLLAAIVLSISSVLLVYVIGGRKITPIRLWASIPLGISPYFLECLSYKFLALYMALSVLACIVPFLFIARKKAFLLISVVSLLIMCMTYQAASGIYPLIVMIISFKYWNNHKKTNKEILLFLGTSGFAFCFALLFFRIFMMVPHIDLYTSTSILPFSSLITGSVSNIKNYAWFINNDFGMIWKIGIALVLLFFIMKSVRQSKQRKIYSIIVSIAVLGLSFILSYGMYSLLTNPMYAPRAMFGFGVFLAILCIDVVSETKKSAAGVVLALNWCFFVFAFSYGNALAEQARYAEFRITLLLHDLSALYPDPNKENLTFQLKNSIDYAPSIKNISKHYPIIERLVPKRLGTDNYWNYHYLLQHFNFESIYMDISPAIDFAALNLPVVSDSYYHTIRSDGSRVLIILKH